MQALSHTRYPPAIYKLIEKPALKVVQSDSMIRILLFCCLASKFLGCDCYCRVSASWFVPAARPSGCLGQGFSNTSLWLLLFMEIVCVLRTFVSPHSSIHRCSYLSVVVQGCPYVRP